MLKQRYKLIEQMFADLSLECRALNDVIEKSPFIC